MQEKQEKTGYKSIALDIAGRIVSGEFPVNSKISGRSLLAGIYHVNLKPYHPMELKIMRIRMSSGKQSAICSFGKIPARQLLHFVEAPR
ncbi:hypothetical protein [Paenibacillus zanthoxyli]|uniref:hypothetical protein n=1 Tax=Paenibacillus zanthoxyli TaxID=369399 RepID=UPI0004716960|nr:hypothetical protein [Paenibacillus zanthoxyli]